VYKEEYSKKLFVPDGVITGANVNSGILANLCINVPNVSVDIRQKIVTNKCAYTFAIPGFYLAISLTYYL
jgi:hypothetical protein